MSNLGEYGFLSWYKKGIGTKITEAEDFNNGSGALGRPKLEVAVKLKATGENLVDETEFSKEIEFLGPGDILGVNKKSIIKAEPAEGVTNFDANYLPYIDFYEEDFLWRYTPAMTFAGTNEAKLRPWLLLLVLERGVSEFSINRPTQSQPLGSVAVNDVSGILHDPADHWAYAHVHVMDARGISSAGHFRSQTDDQPNNGLCRLLASRRLNTDTSYTAFLVPAYETGRLAGLGQYTEIAGTPAQLASWTTAPGVAHEFPIYHQWDFRTDELGSFEELVSKLEPISIDSNLGTRDIDIAAPGYGLDGLSTTTDNVLKLQGALKPPASEYMDTIADDNERGGSTFVSYLRDLVNFGFDQAEFPITAGNDIANIRTSIAGNIDVFADPTELKDDPIIGPPMYGQWYNMITRVLDVNDANAGWPDQLNSDVRYRAIAGLGAKVVKDRQEDFMETAWRQVGAINEANNLIRQAELAKQANKSIFKKHLEPSSESDLVQLSAKVHGKVASAGSGTVLKEVGNSKLPNAALDSGFKKIVRNRSLLNKRVLKSISRNNNITLNDVQFPLEKEFRKRLNTDDNSVPQVGPIAAADKHLAPQESTALYDDTGGSIDVAPELPVNTSPGTPILNQLYGFNSDIENHINPTDSVAQGIFTQMNSYASFPSNYSGPANDPQQAILELEMLGFTESVQGAVDSNTTTIPDPLDIESLSAHLLQKLEPYELIRLRTKKRLQLFNNGGPIQYPDADKPIMAYPLIKEAMYEELLKLSSEYIVPNLGQYANNTITVLETNKAFIESFMVGLNHEMGLELLWREYPTDQRGSYFRQFWSVFDNGAPGVTYDPDIEELHDWVRGEDLGDHHTTKHAGDDQAVLLIRGDLLRKYPNVMIYAQQAKFVETSPGVYDTAVPRLLEEESSSTVRFPIFKAGIGTDVQVVGFDLTTPQMKGDIPTEVPGWFFVFRERPGEVRFGLDEGPGEALPLSSWDDLTWGQLPGGLVEYVPGSAPFHLNVNHLPTSNDVSPNEGVNPVDSSASLAYVLFQKPVKVAFHASDMLQSI